MENNLYNILSNLIIDSSLRLEKEEYCVNDNSKYSAVSLYYKDELIGRIRTDGNQQSLEELTNKCVKAIILLSLLNCPKNFGAQPNESLLKQLKKVN